jgi:lipoprotein-anchoring transpeptidase ErfK/SrfK
MMRSLLCADGYVPSEPGGAQLLCDADARKWIPEGECVTLAEALKDARSKYSLAIKATKDAKEKAAKAEIDAANAAQEARTAKEAHKAKRAEAARLARVACEELTSAAPKVEVAKTSTELTAYAEGAGARAQAAADGLNTAKAAAAKADHEAAEKKKEEARK